MSETNDASGASSSDTAAKTFQAKLAEVDRLISDLTRENAAQNVALRALALYVADGQRQDAINLANRVEKAALGTDLHVDAKKILGVDAL